jgi:hypothetical protein
MHPLDPLFGCAADLAAQSVTTPRLGGFIPHHFAKNGKAIVQGMGLNSLLLVRPLHAQSAIVDHTANRLFGDLA